MYPLKFDQIGLNEEETEQLTVSTAFLKKDKELNLSTNQVLQLNGEGMSMTPARLPLAPLSQGMHPSLTIYTQCPDLP